MANDNNQALTEAIDLLQAGVKGNKEAVLKAHRLLEKLLGINKEDPLIQAYFGSAVCLMGLNSTNQNARLTKAVEGLKILDQAVKTAPENVQVRRLRAIICCRLPESYFHRAKTTIEDFNFLVSRYKDDNTGFTEESYWQILYNLGTVLKNAGRIQEAKAIWSKLLDSTNDPKYAELLKKEGLQSTSPRTNQNKMQNSVQTAVEPPPRPLKESEKQPLIDKGIEIHHRALTSDKDATVQAFTFFNQAHADFPEDNLVAAYYADCLSMTGRDALETNLKFKNAFEATKIFDQAVLNSPDNPKIRFLRAYHSFRLPEAFFNRMATAIGDFSYLIQLYERNSTLFSPETYWQILFDLGLAYRFLGEDEKALQSWSKLSSLAPGAKYLDLIAGQHIPEVEKENLFEKGKRLLELGINGNIKAARLSCEYLQKVHESQSNNPIIAAYFGSALALAGKYATNPNTMFDNAYKGLKMLKTAGIQDPANPEILLKRAFLTFALPEPYFQLTSSAIEDLLSIQKAYEKDHSLFPPETFWKVLYSLGKAFQRSGNDEKAKVVWSTLVTQVTDEKYKAMIISEIKRVNK